MKSKIILLVMISVFVVGCRTIPPGHDPHGPGNSENAPGHHKSKHYGPGNSENAPGQQKRY